MHTGLLDEGVPEVEFPQGSDKPPLETEESTGRLQAPCGFSVHLPQY